MQAALVKNFSLSTSLRKLALLTTAITFTLASFPFPALAVDPNELPTGGNIAVGNGSATINTAGNNMNINQQSQNVIIDWNTFNIGQNASVNFNQPNSSALAVNRVNGSSDPTQILGSLTANGRIMILNPNGVLFGRGSQIDVNGLVASTGRIDDAQVMAGTGHIRLYDMNPNGRVVNDGTINVAEGGLLALVGAQVANNGVINARLAKVALGGGEVATLDFYGDDLLTIEAPSQLAKGDIVSNSGTINADGGVVTLTAQAAKYSVDNVINMTGIINARAVSKNQTGKVVLKASGGRGNINIGGADSVFISRNKRGSGKIAVSNSFADGKGGSIEMTGTYIHLNGKSVLDASGNGGGGNINLSTYLVGLPVNAPKIQQGIQFEEGALIKADAINSGSGGQIHLFSSGTITSKGDYSARGYNGNGQVWLQGLGGMIVRGFADLSNYNSAGPAGTLRLESWAPIEVGSTIMGDLLSKQLYYANVVLASSNILFNDAVSSNSNNMLTLESTGFSLITCIIGGGCTASTMPGHVAFNANVNLKNVEFNSNSSINIDGSKMGNFYAQHINLNTGLNPASKSFLFNGPNSITVGKWGSSEGIVQQAFNWIKTSGTVLLNGVFHQTATANKAFNFGAIGSNGWLDHLIVNNGNLNVLWGGSGTQVHSNVVTVNVDGNDIDWLNKFYEMVKWTFSPTVGTLELGANYYHGRLDATGFVKIIGLLGTPSIIHDFTQSSGGGTFTNFKVEVGHENYGHLAQRLFDLVVDGGQMITNHQVYNETLVITGNKHVSASNGSTRFAQIDLNDAGTTFSHINGDIVNAYQGTAQRGYNITTNLTGTLNLFQSNYDQLVANRSVTVNGAPGTGTHFDNFVSINALGNVFNNISTPVANVNVAGAGQQGVDMTDIGGNVNFGYNNSGETITLNKNVTLNGAAGGTTVGTFNINTLLGNIVNFFGSNVNLNTTDIADRGIAATATGGTLNLSQHVYVPQGLNIPRFMTIIGAVNNSIFTKLIAAPFGAVLQRIQFLQDPGNTGLPPNVTIADANRPITTAQLADFLNQAPAGPGDKEEGYKLCTAKDAGAASECIADAMNSGKTVVVFDITNNRVTLVEENATGHKVQWLPINREELEQLLGHPLEV